MASPSSSREIADQAVALANGTDSERAGAHAALIRLAGDATGPLEQARKLLVRRIRIRSDDYSATSGLTLLNATLSQLGPRDDMEWQPRVWRLPR
ncbi:MAG: hypothetical protein M3083_24025 [Actinomycetota bacterium]|nr:hypothetical protein [Actinomycetota bacterium]